ncbi:DUF2511 domain-containing protein [Hydrogenimonas thermophila]|uniref:DUF2511 domain-containing protein n=1 Tax=Hydrogenimonas thermophila TaxID=223786 RepID=A0A1I5RSY8_9BACT|nr:DUF2511 domain-containing protein [Hydrogenimonas thermophila]SFP61632.1 Protein of unknown function [Hydrogenimonas thermophila]
MKKIALLIVAFIAIGCSSGPQEKVVTKKEFGDKWPLKTDKAIIKCYVDDVGKAPVVIVNGKAYGLTGYADMHYGQNDLKALNEVWADNPKIKGLKMDLGYLTEKAKELCDK